MTRNDMLLKFKEIQDRNVTTVRDKNKTYGAESDAFQAFKDAVTYGSKIETQPQALWNMMSKHLVTVKRWVDEGTIPSEEEAAEKLGDIAIYMSLLELMWDDQRVGVIDFTADNGIVDAGKKKMTPPKCARCANYVAAIDGCSQYDGNRCAGVRKNIDQCGPFGLSYLPLNPVSNPMGE